MQPLVVSILSERRAFQPYGLFGGSPGERGSNLLVYKEGNRLINLGGKNTIHVVAGDRIIINTPGGGGYGSHGAGTHTHRTPATLSMTSGSLNQYRLNQESV